MLVAQHSGLRAARRAAGEEQHREVVDAALTLADELCDFTPFGVFATKQVMWANLEVGSLEIGIQLENRNQIMAGSSGETQEAAAAFFEKRKPRWSEDA